MEEAPNGFEAPVLEPHIVKADEVDQTGADINITPDEGLAQTEQQAAIAEVPSQNGTQLTGQPPPKRPGPPGRPPLKRESSTPAPPPPQQPPPPTPPQQQTTDSLSLAQLKRIVTEMPRVEPVAYTFKYADAQPLKEEINEWFQYTDDDREMMLGSRAAFEDRWMTFTKRDRSTDGKSWFEVQEDNREAFVKDTFAAIARGEDVTSNLAAGLYVLCGIWAVTAGQGPHNETNGIGHADDGSDEEGIPSNKQPARDQLGWIERGAELICRCGASLMIFDKFRALLDHEL